MTYTPAIVTSGVAGYRALRAERDDELTRVAQDREVKADLDYFRQNISNVRSGDDLLADRRLLEVSLTAFGLESEIDNRAFVQRALDEGTDQSGAFANRTSDPRWFDFAEAFGFGDADAGLERSAFEAEVVRRSRPPVDSETRIDPTELSYFRANIGGVESLDDLLGDARLLDVSLEAFGLERGYYTDQHFRSIVEGGLADPNSYANSLDDDRWVQWAAAFEGLDDGSYASVPAFRLDVEREIARNGVPLATSEQLAEDPSAFSANDVLAFQAAAPDIRSAADLVGDPDALKTTLQAFGLEDESLSDAAIRDLLGRAANGDFAVADAQSNSGWSLLARSFADTVGAQAPDVKWFAYATELSIAERGLERLADREPEETRVDISADDMAYFQANATKDLTLDELMNDERLLSVALEAFGLADENRSDSFVRSILESDLSDETAFVNTISNSAWRDFATAFQGGEDARASVWLLDIEDRLIANGAPSEDIGYLRKNANLISESLDFVIDPKLMEITISAFGLPKGDFSREFFTSMIISNPADPNSLVNLVGDDRWKDLVSTIGAFTVAGGNTALESFKTDVETRYTTAVFELAVGEQDQTMRLALNFERLANETNRGTDEWFRILGDQPMRRVVDTALGLPAEFVNLDIEAQNEVYKSRMQDLFGDGSPRALESEANMRQLIDRFLFNSGSGGSGGVPTTAPGYAALTLMQSSAAAARSFGSF